MWAKELCERYLAVAEHLSEATGLLFEVEHTGGGCSALIHNFSNSSMFLMVTDDAEVPMLNSEGVTVGLYDNDDYAEGDWESFPSMPKAINHIINKYTNFGKEVK